MKKCTKCLAVICAVALLAGLATPVLASDGRPEAQDAMAAATPPAVTPEAEAAPQIPRDDEPAPAEDDTEPRLFENPEDLFGPEPAPASCCVDECRRDKHCDSVCGAPGAGVCIQVNSCCRECACLF